MLFSDYVKILRNHLKRKFGQKRLCDLLFDFVTDYAEVLDGEVIPVDIGKDRISKMMNGKEEIPLFIRNHICDDSVNEQLILSFEKRIVPLLVDECEDLCFQLMQIIEKDNISPSRKAGFKRIANEKTLAVFLADVYVYSVMTNSEGRYRTEDEVNFSDDHPSFVLKGIRSGKIVETPIIHPFVNRIGYTKDDIKNRILEMIKETSAIHIAPYQEPAQNSKDLFGLITKPLRGKAYTYDSNKQETITQISNILGYQLPDDFYELGDLCYSFVPYFTSAGGLGNTIEGSAEAKHKLECLDAIYEAIYKAFDTIPFVDDFSSYFLVELVIENAGGEYDEDVRVTLKFPPKTVASVKDVMDNKKRSVNYLVTKVPSILKIERGEDFLDYDETSTGRIHSIKPFITGSAPEVESQDVKDLLLYYIVTNDEYDCVEVKFDKINPHDAVAFPNVVLLKNNSFDTIDYNIRSKNMASVISGKIRVSKRSET
ncbi:MAG: hypothetical protein J6Y58_05850 [Clostridiales bacterium]|nr:hypothetical protein [Clostridiales bacterium]